MVNCLPQTFCRSTNLNRLNLIAFNYVPAVGLFFFFKEFPFATLVHRFEDRDTMVAAFCTVGAIR